MSKNKKPTQKLPSFREAFSYIRFSSKKQADGASLERQLAGTRAYCEKNHLILNETLTFRDLGISATYGRNLEHGLGDLLDACETGLIPKGAAIVVEALDRLSRERPRAVSTLLGTLLDRYGLEVHLTGINKVLYPKSQSAAEEGMDLLWVTMLAIRASEEQETKALRLSDAFRRKRERVGKKEILLETSENKLPWWIVYNPETGRLESPPERAETVRLIFKWASEGTTSPEIARRLDARMIPTWRPRASRWSPSRIRHMILSDSPLGVLESTARSKALGHDFLVSDYYPALIDRDLALLARGAMAANSRYGRLNAVPDADAPERPLNLLRGLLRIEGHAARFDCRKNGKQKKWAGYYYGFDPEEKKNLGLVSGKLLELTLLAGLREITPDDMKPRVEEIDPAETALASARQRLATTTKSLDRIVAAIELSDDFGELLERMKLLRAAKAELENKVQSLEIKVRSVQVGGDGENELDELKSFRDADLDDNAIRGRLAQAIRKLVTRIDLSFTMDRGFRGLTARSIVEGSSLLIADPCPPRKTRKPLYMVVHFRRGALRSIMRPTESFLEEMKRSNVIISGCMEAKPSAS